MPSFCYHLSISAIRCQGCNWLHFGCSSVAVRLQLGELLVNFFVSRLLFHGPSQWQPSIGNDIGQQAPPREAWQQAHRMAAQIFACANMQICGYASMQICEYKHIRRGGQITIRARARLASQVAARPACSSGWAAARKCSQQRCLQGARRRRSFRIFIL